MKNKILFAIALVCLVFIVGSSRPAPTAWEYKTEDRCFDEGRINTLGQQGWELAGFSENGRGAWHCIFKRTR